MKFKLNMGLKSMVLLSLLSLVSMVLMHCSGLLEKVDLEAGFQNPPNSAKPRVWWHWMDGNITQEGIRADLEWMHRVGIGGFQTFDIGDFPLMVEKRLVYMSPEWKDAFQFTTQLVDSLGMEMGIAASPGFSESGGPWVKPEQAMKKYVWSEIRIEGGKPFSDILPHPPTVTGPFQNLKYEPRLASSSDEQLNAPEYYADAVVVAFRIPEIDFAMAELQPKVTSSGGIFSLEKLTDGDLVKSSLLPPAPAGQKAWVQFEFTTPVTVQSITLVDGGGGGGFGFGSGSSNKTLEVSDDGVSFHKVIDIIGGRATEKTLSFSPVSGKYFRYCVRTPQPSPQSSPQQNRAGMPGLGMFGRSAAAPEGTPVAELVLHTGARVNRFEDKAAFASATDLIAAATPEAVDAVKKADVIDLASNMEADGKLEWIPPAGRWVILRIGYSLIGTTNHPASVEATGLEVDKLSKKHVKDYFTEYLDQYEDASGGLMGQKGFKYVLNDSWEAGTQNWTDNMITEFGNYRGYDMLPWVPVLAGYVVEDAQASDRFLWDFRRTLEEMVAEYHYDQLTDILKERGMGRYTESHEGGRALIADGMEVKRQADVPMSATWVSGGMGGGGNEISTRHQADVRESASVSHIYGKKYIAAESLTSWGPAWGYSPDMLKPTADGEFACGLNRIVIHASPHNPVDDMIPGTSLGPFGQMFTRHETWAEQSTAWLNYLARTSYMLQQGKMIADIAYLYGEGNNITALFGQTLPDVPAGYEFDFVNADALVNVMSVKNGHIITPNGMSYRILALDQSTSRMTVPVLQKIQDMVKAGAIVLGNKPVVTPSLSDDPKEFESIVNELWVDESGVNSVGKGKMYAGYTIQEVLDMQNLMPDFVYTKPQEDTRLLYVHRQLGDIDFYWVNNRNNRVEEIEATFRVDGKTAEIWHPETGKIEEASYSIEDGATKVPLYLEPNDAVFVVFGNKAEQMTRTVPRPEEQILLIVEGPWTVSFQENRGAPAQVTFDALTPWNENTHMGIKYFSGTGTYTKSINASAEWFTQGEQIWLDLGEVQNLAEVVVNGKSLGIVWKTPFKVDLSEALKEGDNELEIRVTNLWVNRLIGDEQPGVEKTYTYTGLEFYTADSPLMESGLLGPLRLVARANLEND